MARYPGQPKESDTADVLSEPEDGDDFGLLRPHSTQITIKWLEDTYHYEDGICLPRSTIYEHYLDFCQREQLQPVNAASFGKIIRQQFPTLTTRRLGTRGQSKYHYYGLGIKPSSRYYTEEYVTKQQNQGTSKKETKDKERHPFWETKEKPSTVLPPFPNVKTLCLAESLPKDKLHTFMVMYRAHCQRILDSVIRANFSEVENFLLHFWQGMPTHLLPVLASDIVVDLIALCDSTLYKVISDVLIISPLQNFPESLAQEVIKFSSMLSTWLDGALKGLPDSIKDAKQKVAESFTKSLKRQTSLMHLAQAARNALRGEDSLSQLKKDWNALDLNTIFGHTLYAIQSLDIPPELITMVPGFVGEFAGIIDEKNSVEDFVVWVEQLVERCICKAHDDASLRQVGRTFLLAWKFFTSKVVREFTLQSAPSFGTFHLLHMLVDDYIIHCLESSLEKERRRQFLQRIDQLKQAEEDGENIQVEDQFLGMEEEEEESPPEAPPIRHTHLSMTTADVSHTHAQLALPEPVSTQPSRLHGAQSFDRLPTISQTAMADLSSSSTAATSIHPISSIRFSSVQTPFTVTAGALPPTNAVLATTLPISSSLLPRFDRTATTTTTSILLNPNATQGRQPDKLLDTAPQTHLQLSHSLGSFPVTHTHTHAHAHTVMNPMGLSPASLQSHATGLRSQALPFPTQVAPPSRQDLNHGMSMAIHNILNMNPATQLGGIQAAATTGGTAMPPLPMPLTHSLPTSIHAPLGHARGLPLLPTLPAMYPYAPYGGMGGMQGLPSQPGGSSAAAGMVRVNTPSPFPPQALVSGYPAYVPPSIYGNAPVSTGNFTR